MFFSEAALKSLADDLSALDGKLNKLVEGYVGLKLSKPRAQEFASQGFPRRLKTMARCIKNVFALIPPARQELPTSDALSDATINVQGFVFNTYGAVDNLAWIWVSEKGQTRGDGTPIPDSHVGLGPDNTSVRQTFSAEFQAYLAGLDDWMKFLAKLRHALAHRIPLYIPPYVIRDADVAAYHELAGKMNDAIKAQDLSAYDALSAERLSLGRFQPWISQSFAEGAKPVVFHPQMLSDFKTIEELGRKMLEELSGGS
jgi:hypothetical protein